jgi:hypothetical protein
MRELGAGCRIPKNGLLTWDNEVSYATSSTNPGGTSSDARLEFDAVQWDQ